MTVYRERSTAASLVVFVRRRVIDLSVQHLIESVDGAPQMGNSYRAANHQSDIKCVEKFGARDARGYALLDVIRDAVVTPQHYRSDQAKQFFSALVECAIFVRLGIEREESLDAEMIAAEQLFVHVGAITIEFIH